MLAVLLLCWFIFAQRAPAGGRTVQRAPAPISAEEIRIAKSGEQAYGHRLTVALLKSRGEVFVELTVERTDGGELEVPLNCLGLPPGAPGLPPEMLSIEASCDGGSVPCDARPGSAEAYGQLLNSQYTYPMSLSSYGDFSKPGHYVVRIFAKCPLWPSAGGEKTALLASNEIEFDVPADATANE